MKNKYIKLRKIIIVAMIACFLSFTFIGCKSQTTDSDSAESENNQENREENTQEKNQEGIKYNVDNILAKMTIEQKVAQILQGAMYHVTEEEMQEYNFGSILSNYEGMDNSAKGWKNLVLGYQKAAAKDPRWGRTYESYSSDYELVAKLGSAFVKGQLENGVIPCAKHFMADGNAEYNTGEGDFLIDRGDATLSENEIKELLNMYQKVIDAGVPTVMLNHGSINGVKLHQHKQLITDELKGKMGFQGFVVSDWESIHNIEGTSLKEKVITAINAGIDMLMEPQYYLDCYQYIVEAVSEGRIATERIDDAVKRIITVKLNLGIFSDPMQENLTMNIKELGESGSRDIARQLVEKSLVLLKNDNTILPLKSGQKIFVTGPAANDSGVQCGGWTVTWQGKQDSNNERYVKGSTSILDGLQEVAKEYDFEIITNEKEAADADLTILCVGEKPYAEWEGDSRDLSLTGSLGLVKNEESIQFAKSLKKPTITLIVAGRNVMINDYLKDWDAIVMCYLPGSEGDGVANVLVGNAPFVGKLPMPWYPSVDDIGTNNFLYPMGYGMEGET